VNHGIRCNPPLARPNRRWRAALTSLVIASVNVTTSACDLLDGLIDVEAPGRIVAETFEGPDNAATLLVGTIGDFECAFVHYVIGGGLMGEELQNSTGAVQWFPYDQRDNSPAGGILGAYAERTCDEGTAPAIYRGLSTARWQADHLLELLGRWTDQQVPNRTALTASASVFSAYSTLLLGEGMCSAAFDLGPEQTPAQIFARAEVRFTTAIAAAQSAGSQDILNLARLGRARTRLNLGRRADAAADAALIPANFSYNATYAATPARRQNLVFVHNHRNNWITVEQFYRDVRFQGVADPRVATRNTGMNSPTAPVQVWLQLKYPSEAASITLARWEEAQLIVAEAEVSAGNLQRAVDIINTLHSRATPALPPFTSTSSAEIRDQIIQERRAALFLESHHLGDMRRYQLTFRPPAGTQYPGGSGSYGSQTCFPLPDLERLNNPNFTG